ncbi:hypothetical protein [Sediminicurvatus halobius]|uniref:hypothetical protein n=1 Tax=Sediminicurvatus halobius TaxID=2182432 RepID=UPI0011B25702|nr:hypothetical protein [Spiribacter halobius]UEX78760.1 hypothetical protein LMH63_03695 [Spiribacter halobius]
MNYRFSYLLAFSATLIGCVMGDFRSDADKLHAAVEDGDASRVQAIINEGVSTDARDADELRDALEAAATILSERYL